mmetsp:Transcript_24027/g.36968  ORF Transcript_24027/g.36968 Transcript_24027/m.36968 type:complete len:207 (-) Transcript_24027:279-899(-)
MEMSRVDGLISPGNMQEGSHHALVSVPLVKEDYFSKDLEKETIASSNSCSSLATPDETQLIQQQPAPTPFSEETLYWNILKMTIMWSASSFTSYLLNFMNKYLEGSIYSNNYAESIAGGLACFVGAKIYAEWGKKTAFITSYGLGLTFGLIIYLLESETLVIPEAYLEPFGSGSLKHRREMALNFIVPQLTFFSKFGIQLAFLSTY